MSQITDAIQQKYGITATEGEVKLCGWDIRRGRTRLINVVSSRISEYLVLLEQTVLYVSYDNVTEEISSVLDPIPIDS